MTNKIVEVLRPPIPEPPYHQCEGTLKCHPNLNDSYRSRRAARVGQDPDDRRCGQRASHRVDGQYYCGQHAGRAALQYLLNMPED